MALLTRKRLILIEEESTYGTDPTPTGDDAVLVRDLSITPQQSDVVSRDLIRPYLGASEQLLANTRVECTSVLSLQVLALRDCTSLRQSVEGLRFLRNHRC